ncbi:helix-turn-helix domain-containing protein [Fibrobacter sp.]|uniref:helix-turn-helix domain-containing protein n=1 Tax=Fibrobacter sp. TaxID=35828 RepID=UPI00386E4FC2
MRKNSIDFESFLRRTGSTLAEVARKAGVSKSMMTLLNNGSTTPSYSTLIKFHRLGMTPAEMFGEKQAATISDADCEKIADFVAGRIR